MQEKIDKKIIINKSNVLLKNKILFLKNDRVNIMNINRKIIPDLDPDNGIDIINNIREKI